MTHGGHHGDDHLVAIFPSWSDARTAIAELQDNGIDEESLGLLLHAEGDHGLVLPAQQDVLDKVGNGAVVGAPVGMLAGLAVLALAVPGIGTVGVAGILAIESGAAAVGAILGSIAGATMSRGELAEADSLEHLPLAPGHVLVLVRPHDGWAVHLWTDEHGDMAWGPITEEITDLFERHGGRMIEVGRSGDVRLAPVDLPTTT
jgi:hypothetical protein